MPTTLGPENRLWFCLRPTRLTHSSDGRSALVHNHMRADGAGLSSSIGISCSATTGGMHRARSP